MVTVGAKKREGFVRKEKFGYIPDVLADFVMYSAFRVCRVSSKNSDLKGDVLLYYDIMGHPDGREAAVAEFMLYAIFLSQDVSNVQSVLASVRYLISQIWLSVIEYYPTSYLYNFLT